MIKNSKLFIRPIQNLLQIRSDVKTQPDEIAEERSHNDGIKNVLKGKASVQ